MYDNAIACDNAILTAGCIRNDAIICGNARVRENAATHIAPVITGQSVVMGDLSGSVVCMAAVLSCLAKRWTIPPAPDWPQ